ncbi:MAG: hypothetical protein ACREN5_13185 [Gemmatimonadales bacterium]
MASWSRPRWAVVWGLVLSVSCATRPGYRAPESSEGYAILVPDDSPWFDALAAALRRRGVDVERRVRGDRGPTAVLITRTVDTLEHAWLHDTRTGRLLATASLRALSEASGPLAASAAALADSLLADFERRRRR